MEKIKNKFFMKFAPRSVGECWEWQGNKDKDGYGRFCIDHDKTVGAHRFSYEIYRGKIPKGMYVCHKCDNPSCVNPNHLFIGTVLDNHQDMDRKKRRVNVSGEKHGMVKLKKGEVEFIRKVYAVKKITQQQLADKFRVSRRLVGMIINYKIWK